MFAAAAACLVIAGCGEGAATASDASEAVAADEMSALGGAALTSAPAAAQRAGAVRAMRFEPAVIVDPTGFDRPMAVASLFIPYGWRTEGGVFWASDFLCVNGYNFLWRAVSPDGAMSMAISPHAAWAFASGGPASPQPGCPVVQIASVRQYLEYSIRRDVPGAVLLDYRNRPDLVAEVGVRAERTPMPMGETQIWAEGGEALFAFRQNGRDMRGTMSAVVKFSKLITDTSAMFASDALLGQYAPTPQTRIESVSAYAFPGFVATAPNGMLNIGYFEAMRKTIRPNTAWSRAIAGHNTRIAQVALDEGRKRAEMILQSNQEIARIRQETWNAQQESADRRAREFGEAIKGVETWRDADAPGGSVELSTTNHAWRLRDGTYVMTDDPNFDPWRDLQLEGRKLEAVQ